MFEHIDQEKTKSMCSLSTDERYDAPLLCEPNYQEIQNAAADFSSLQRTITNRHTDGYDGKF